MLTHTQVIQRLYKQCLYTARSYAATFGDYRQYSLEIRQKFDANKTASNSRELIMDTRKILKEWRHPVPYTYPSAPNGTCEDRNAPLPKMYLGDYKEEE